MATSSSAAVTTPNVFIPTPPVLDLTDHLQAASKWRTWEERLKAFAAVAGLSEQSDEYQVGLFISTINDETLKIS